MNSEYYDDEIEYLWKEGGSIKGIAACLNITTGYVTRYIKYLEDHGCCRDRENVFELIDKEQLQRLFEQCKYKVTDLYALLNSDPEQFGLPRYGAHTLTDFRKYVKENCVNKRLEKNHAYQKNRIRAEPGEQVEIGLAKIPFSFPDGLAPVNVAIVVYSYSGLLRIFVLDRVTTENYLRGLGKILLEYGVPKRIQCTKEPFLIKGFDGTNFKADPMFESFADELGTDLTVKDPKLNHNQGSLSSAERYLKKSCFAYVSGSMKPSDTISEVASALDEIVPSFSDDRMRDDIRPEEFRTSSAKTTKIANLYAYEKASLSFVDLSLADLMNSINRDE